MKIDNPDTIPFPKDASSVLDRLGAQWMKRAGVKGVGLARRDGVLKFVILVDDPTAHEGVPPMIEGYPTHVEPAMAAAAGKPRR